MNIEKRLAEINARKVEIRGLLESDQEVKLDEIQEELRNLEKEEKELRAKLETLKSIQTGEVQTRTIDIFGQQQETRTTSDDPLSAPEYRSAYLRSLQGKQLTEVEQRALTTATGSAGAAVPTTTMNMIVDKLRQTSVLFPKINVSYVPGNLSIVIANAKNAASWKTEGNDGTAKDDTVTNIELSGYELIKLVEISAAADAMTIDAFEAYIASEIGRQMAIAIENAILNGSGSGQPTGLLGGITWDEENSTTWAKGGAIGYDNLMDALALLPTMYHNNAVFVMNRRMVFAGIRKIKDDMKQPIFTYNPQDRAAMTILGYPIIMDDYMPDNTILLGDLGYYYMNFAKNIELSSSREAGFKSGKVTYRGLAVADGKPALDEAFVKLSEATV